MFDVKHFMEEDVFHDELRDAGMVHAAIEKNLIGARIVTTELAAPGAGAPAEMRTHKVSFEEFSVQTIEHLCEIEKAALRISGGGADAGAAHALDALAGTLRAGVFKVRLRERFWRAATIDA